MPGRKWSTKVEPPKPSKRQRALEAGKSTLIVMLTISAVYLAGCCLTYSGTVGSAQGLGWVSAWLTSLREPPVTVSAVTASGQPVDETVRIALCGRDSMGNVARYGVQYDAEAVGRLSESLSFYISSALASADESKQITEDEWRNALMGPGIYFELLGSVPLQALSGWQKGSTVNLSLPATAKVRRLMLAYREDVNVSLYYINESNGMYYACETGVIYEGNGGLAERLEHELEKNGPNGTSFAFEKNKGEGFGGLDPYVMITDPAPAKVYQASNPIPLQDVARREELQRSLSFPNHYQAGGEVAIWEGNEKLRLDNNGTATYQAADHTDPRYPVDVSGGEGDVTNMIAAARKIADSTVGTWCGTAQLYLEDASKQEDGSWVLRFGYSINGSAVRLPWDGCAAQFVVREGRIDAYTLTFRTYEDTGEITPVLPVTQAVAAMNALLPAGRELTLCYQDSGDGMVLARWAAG